MPKIIDDVKNSIVREAQKQVLESGYASMTIRSVAKGCGIAVGTIYNYFPSKDMMTAAFMLEDWLAALAAMERGCKDADGPRDAFRAVYAELTAYTDKYRRLFEDSAATKSLGGAFYARHKQLRSQISRLLEPICDTYARVPSAFLSDFVTEALLAWTGEQKPYEEIEEIIIQLFK